MYKICVFGGTTEGRELVEFLNAQLCEVTACVATEYGQALLPEAERLTVSARRLPADEIKALLTDRHFDLVIDATHPYAASITKSIARACAETGVERWRLLRGASDAPEDAVFVESTEKAIEFLDQTEGNILLTTGSKELKAYSQIKDFAERVSVGERLSYPDEKITCGTAAELASREFDKLSVALIENPAPDAVVTHGLPDEVFLREMDPAHVVPMTKSEVRAVCLSKLALTERAVCWDVGAGTGSVSIEMALQAKRGRVYAVERQEDALALLARNKAAFSAGNLEIVSGTAPAACEALPAPTHMFLGGTAGNLNGILDAALRKNPHVRIVATAVTLESVGALAARMADFEKAECVSLQAARARTAGSYHLMQGQNPVYIFTMQNRREQA